MNDAIPDSAAAMVPSGMPLHLSEIVRDTQGVGGLTVRYRYVAPDLAARRLVDDGRALLGDLEHLCNRYALAQLAGSVPMPSQIVISVSETQTVFGESAPDVMQVFEGFRPQDGVCIWEPF
jgi:hypothetical protein